MFVYEVDHNFQILLHLMDFEEAIRVWKLYRNAPNAKMIHYRRHVNWPSP